MITLADLQSALAALPAAIRGPAIGGVNGIVRPHDGGWKLSVGLYVQSEARAAFPEAVVMHSSANGAQLWFANLPSQNEAAKARE